MKKTVAVVMSLLLVTGVLAGCGSEKSEESIVSEKNDTTSMEEQVQAEQSIIETETTQNNASIKYSSLSSNSLGNPSEFADCLENKLQLILGVNDFILEDKDIKFDAKTQTGTRGCLQTVYSYKFSGVGGEEGGGLYFELNIYYDDDHPGNIKSISMKTSFPGSSYKVTTPVLANADQATFDSNMCAFLMPIAVFDDCNSKEELLEQLGKYETKKTTSLKDNIGKKLLTDTYVSYFEYNEKGGWINFSSISDEEQRNKYDKL